MTKLLHKFQTCFCILFLYFKNKIKKIMRVVCWALVPTPVEGNCCLLLYYITSLFQCWQSFWLYLFHLFWVMERKLALEVRRLLLLFLLWSLLFCSKLTGTSWKDRSRPGPKRKKMVKIKTKRAVSENRKMITVLKQGEQKFSSLFWSDILVEMLFLEQYFYWKIPKIINTVFEI